MGLADIRSRSKINVDCIGRIQCSDGSTEPVFLKIRIRPGENFVVLIDRNINSFPDLDLIHPLSVPFVVTVCLAEHSIGKHARFTIIYGALHIILE